MTPKPPENGTAIWDAAMNYGQELAGYLRPAGPLLEPPSLTRARERLAELTLGALPRYCSTPGCRKLIPADDHLGLCHACTGAMEDANADRDSERFDEAAQLMEPNQ